MKKSDSELPNRMRYWRKQRGLTLKEVAQRMGCTEATAQRYETGVRATTIEIMDQIARALDIEAADLLPCSMNRHAYDADERELVQAYRIAPDSSRHTFDVLKDSVLSFAAEPIDIEARRATRKRG